MRILIFNWKDRTHSAAGGAEVVTHELGKRLAARGHQVTLLCARVPGRPDREPLDGMTIIRQGNKWTVYGAAAWTYLREFRGQVDVIIDQINTLPFFTPLYARETTYALIHQLARELWFYELPFPLNAVGYVLEPLYLRLYRQRPCLTVSESTKQDLLKLGFDPKLVTIIPEGLDLPKPFPQPPKSPEPTCVFVGRLNPGKQVDHILKAFNLIQQRLPEARLWIIGQGAPSYERRLRRLAESLPRVSFLGKIPFEELLTRVASSHVLLMASKREGWGLVVTEANALGVPAVVYDSPGLRDSTQDGINGLICRENTPEDLAEKTLAVLTQEPLRHRLSEGARVWASAFTWDRSEAVLHQTLTRSGSS